jgi:hypothetical protein
VRAATAPRPDIWTSKRSAPRPSARRSSGGRRRDGLVVAAVFEDRGVSGGAALDRRPGLLAALAELRRRRPCTSSRPGATGSRATSWSRRRIGAELERAGIGLAVVLGT